MSRPSTTMPPSPMTSRCSRSSRARTSGTALTALTAEVTAWVADRSGDVAAVDRDRRGVRVGAGDQQRRIGLARRPRTGRRRRCRARASTRSSRGTSPRCRGSAAPAVWRLRARCSTSRSPTARPSRRRHPLHAPASRLLRTRELYRCVVQPRSSREDTRWSALSVEPRSSSTSPHRAPGVVVDPEVLDVDPDLARVGEQPGQLARMVGYGDEDRGLRDRGTAVLAGDHGRARDAPVEQGAHGVPVARVRAR